MSRRKTVQEKRADLADERAGSRVRKSRIEKPYFVQTRLPAHVESQFPWAHEWHGHKKFAEYSLAEQYAKKLKRCETLVKYEYRIVDLESNCVWPIN